MKKYEAIEHTADMGIRVKGATLKDLFKNAAAAMFDIIAGKTAKKSQGTKSIAIKQKAGSSEELLAIWLNELLSLSAINETIFENFKINKLDENTLEAQVKGSSIKNYRVNTEIKAATYHELKIKKNETGWQAEVIFDV